MTKEKDSTTDQATEKIAGRSRDSNELIEVLAALAKADLEGVEGRDKAQAARQKNEAAYRLLELFCEAVREAETPHPLLSRHVADCIARIYYGIGEGGNDAEQEALATLLSRRDWRTDPRTVFPKITAKLAAPNHLRWAIEVERLKAGGKAEDDAIPTVAKRFAKSYDAIRAAHQAYRRYARYRANDPTDAGCK